LVSVVTGMVSSCCPKIATEWLAEHPTSYAYVIPQAKVRDSDHLQQELKRIESLGGEGLIVRRPGTYYKDGRTAEILKVKNHQDAEARVLAPLPREGRNQGRLGVILVALDDGTQFKIGSGFSDAEREDPPSIGEVVTFKYYGKHSSGIPRFPSFLRLRRDRNL
jgi:DNA ligase-1